jgi:hypothetical protein
MTTIRSTDLQGGLSLKDKTIIEDNQLSIATNVYYNKDKNLQTRAGQRAVGKPVPENATIVDACDAITGFAVGGDGANLATGVAKRGTFSVQFDVDVSVAVTDFTTLIKTVGSVDITNLKGYFSFWLFVPTGFNTNLTSVKTRYGSDSSNYYEWTLGTLTQNDWNYIVLPYTGATTIGTVIDTAIDYFELRIDYAATYTDKIGVRIDSIATYSQSSGKPMMSLKYFESTDTPSKKYLLTNVGTCLYLYYEENEYWELIRTGLTETNRLGFFAYKNIMYFGSKGQNSFDFNGTAIAEHTGADTYQWQYGLLANDIAYVAGDLTVPTTLAWTNALPADAKTFPNVLAVDEDDSSGTITGLTNLGPIIIVSKERKIYQVDVSTPTSQQLDYSDGALGNRALTRVENDVYFLNERGVFTLAQRQATVGSLRADSLSDDIKPLIDNIVDKNVTAGFYSNQLNQWYLFADTNGDGANDACYVRSVLTRGWTQYLNVAANEAVVYQDFEAGGEIAEDALLIANALSGQMIQIEYGTNDQGIEILHEMETKTQDYKQPEMSKTFHYYDIFGFINEIGEATISSTLGQVNVTADATLLGTTYADAISGSQQILGGSVLGGSALGGAEGTIDLYPFFARIPLEQTDTNLAINVQIDKRDTVLIFTKTAVNLSAMTEDFIPNNFIL